jgi:hypothetical protein
MIRMKASRTLTASQSPTGKQLNRGDAYEVESEVLARDHERRGMGERVASRPEKPAVKPEAAGK